MLNLIFQNVEKHININLVHIGLITKAKKTRKKAKTILVINKTAT
jgi:hypothetical protein